MLSKSSWSRVTLVVVFAILVSAIGMVSPARAASYVWWYTSDVDGSLQPYGAWIPTTYDPSVPAPVVIHLHGYGGRASSSFNSFQRSWADSHGWILVNADGRREWSNYDHVGELDLYDIIADLKARGYNVDDDRLYLTGCSMGGHGSYREAFRHPDRWAAIAPGAGWTDYRNFFPQYYEHASNIGRASYFQAPPPFNRLDPYYVDPAREPILETASSLWQVENANWLPLYIMYDSGDSSNPTMNATNVIDKMIEFGYSDHLQVTAGTGGHCASYNLTNIYNFFLGKTRVADPPEVVYTTNSLQYNQAYWVQLDRFTESNQWARLHAEIVAPNTIEVETDYLMQFTLFLNSSLVDMGAPVEVTIDGLSTLTVTPAPSVPLYASLDDANQVAGWSTSATLPGGLVKKEGLSGPIADALLSKFLIVYGTSGSAEETAANLRAAQEMAVEWNNAFILNWRGSGWPPSKVQPGHENDWWIPYNTYPYYYFTGAPRSPTTSAQTIVWPVADTAVTAEDMAGYNLILYGEPDDNALIAQMEGDLPFQLSAGRIQVQDRVYTDQPGKPLDYSFIYPNPLNPERYVLVSRTGLFNDWYDAVTGWGGAFAIGTELQSLSFSFPDYIIGWQPTNIAYWSDGWHEAGYFDGSWQLDDDAPSTVADFTGTPGDDGWYHSGMVSLTAGDALGGFGVAKVEYSIDGGPWTEYTEPFEVAMDGTMAVQYRAVDENGQVLYAVGLPWDGYPSGLQWLGYKAPGNVEETHVILINATQDTMADTQRAYDEGWIDNYGVLNSLLRKLNNAQAALDQGDVEEAIDLLGAYINELEAQSGKHVTAEAAALLIADAQWVIDHLE